MSHTVFILGAGASKSAGAPLMWNFLDVAEDLALARNLDTETLEAFSRVFRGISHLRVAQSKARLDLNNVEAVFAAFEMAELLGIEIPGLPSTELLISDMRRVIATTLDVSVRYPVSRAANGNLVRPHSQYGQLADCVKSLDEGGPGSVAVITFNYDLAFERALGWHKVRYSYCLEGVTHRHVPYLKLHGSLNWAQCQSCRAVQTVDMQAVFRANERLVQHRIEQGDIAVTLPITPHIVRMLHCGQPMEPGVVPPVWNKTQYHRELQAVWSRAAAELQQADNIVVIGYSIPDTDQFFRYLYALASTSETRLKRFVVINPDPVAEKRFRDLLGQSAESRFEYRTATWEEAADWVVQQDWQRRGEAGAA